MPEAVSVVIPVLGRGDQLSKVVAAWERALRKLGRDWELIAVCEGEEPPAPALGVSPARRGGLGAHLRAGFAASRHPVVIVAGCDTLYQPADVEALLARLDEVDPEFGRPLDVVNGFRAARPVPAACRFAGALVRLAVRAAMNVTVEPLPGWLGWRAHARARLLKTLFGVAVRDVDSEFTSFRRPILARAPLQSDGPFAAAELFAKANFQGALMAEVPLSLRGLPAAPPGPQWADARRVFRRPDFGPPVLEKPTVPEGVPSCPTPAPS